MAMVRFMSRVVPQLPCRVPVRSASSWGFCKMPSREDQVLMGAVSYDPSVSTIWERMRSYLNQAGCPFDFQLHTNYEQQVAALMDGRIDIAWNGPIAHVVSQSLAGPNGLVSLGMRDCDQDFVSVCVARKDAGVNTIADINGKKVGTGASDSPQAHVVPIFWLKEQGVKPGLVVPFDLDLGKHGDTAIGEIAAMEALVKGDIEVALLSDMMWQRGLAGALPSVDADALRAAAATVPATLPTFDHCQFDALSTCPAWKRDSFVKAIFAMDMSNPDHAEVMKLEGISKTWMPPRQEGYAIVQRAVRDL